jgi:Helix-turn-helix of DDE superfamily endonuclease
LRILLSMNYKTLHKAPKQFQSVSGFSHLDFLALHKEFALVWHQQMQHWTADGKPRLRSYSVRSDSVLKTTEDMLLFILSYLKNNPTQEYHSAQWGMTQSQAHPWLQRCQAILRMTLQRCDMTPARTNLELLERLDAQDDVARKGLRIDGTERPIERPQDNQKQKKQYSGKKKSIP